MLTKEGCAKLAEQAAVCIKSGLRIPSHGDRPIGVILGTGWGDVLEIGNRRSCKFTELPGFEMLGSGLKNHKREVVYGSILGRNVIALNGRVHLNEAPMSEEVYQMVRLQAEMLFYCGVEKLIVTNAIGGLCSEIVPNSIFLADGFLTICAPDMPLVAGEFVSPEDALDPELRARAKFAAASAGFANVFEGGLAMVRGPFFEGRKYDKAALRMLGASAVGMSVVPEACVAAVYKAKMVHVGFISNDAVEEHSDAENVRRAKEQAAKLGEVIRGIIARVV